MDIAKKTKEIDVLALVLKVLKDRKSLAAFVVAFAIIGVVYALAQQKEYTASVTLAPEMSSMGMSQSISDIAGAIGMDLGGKQSVDAIYPEIYPDVFASNDFILKLFDLPVTYKGVKKTYYEHLKADPKTPFYNKPMKWLGSLFAPKDTTARAGRKLDPFRLTKEQNGICNAIRANIACELNKATNVITISVTDIDPEIAACLSDTLQHRLQDYITLYRTKKARNDLEYSRKINAEARAQYERARQVYAAYCDANTDVQLMSFQSKMEDLENDMQLKFNNYSSTAQQVQKAEAKVQENTPVFTVLQAASVPLIPSGMPRSMMVIIFVMLGVACDVVWVLVLKDLVKGKLARKS